MRILILLAALLLAASTVAAQQPDFDETYQVRVGFGDIPTTTRAEPGGGWNVEQRLRMDESGDERTATFDLPLGTTLDNVTCTVAEGGAVCASFSHGTADGRVTVTVAAGPESDVHVTTRGGTERQAFILLVAPPTADPSQLLVVYVPNDADVTMPTGAQSPGSSTGGTAVIHFVSGAASDPLPSPLWASVHPQGAAVRDGPAGAGQPYLNWLLVGIAFALGMFVWAFLVSKGAVQRRVRKQTVGTAAHTEKAREGKPVLEARRRALMAGLKELEMAKMSKEVADDAYDTVKADFKQQAVTVLRAIEQTGDEKK